MLLKLYSDNPNDKEFYQIVRILEKGGLIIYPTDTVYAMGCSLSNHKAMQRMAQLKGKPSVLDKFSLIFPDLSHLSKYAKLDNACFKLMKKNLPGAFTFIVPAENKLPVFFKTKKKTVGIRIPNHYIPRRIAEELGHPLVSTSIHDTDKVIEYTTDPELIHEKYGKVVDLVIDGGYGKNIASTVVDCTHQGEFDIVRQGIGELK